MTNEQRLVQGKKIPQGNKQGMQKDSHALHAQDLSNLQKEVRVIPDEPGTEACRFCGSNTVPPDLMTELQSGALPSELKRLDWFDEDYEYKIIYNRS